MKNTVLENTRQMIRISLWKSLQRMSDRKDGGNICGTFFVKANELRGNSILGWFWSTLQWPGFQESAQQQHDLLAEGWTYGWFQILQHQKFTYKSANLWSMLCSFINVSIILQKPSFEWKVGSNFIGTLLLGKERTNTQTHQNSRQTHESEPRKVLEQDLEEA